MKKFFSMLLLLCGFVVLGATVLTINAEDEATEDEATYELVTSESTPLAIGDVIIITNAASNKAISTKQNTNNRGEVEVTAKEGVITAVDGLQEITLEAGAEDAPAGSFAFYVEGDDVDGYLYPTASGSNNHLKTQANKDLGASWVVTITASSTTVVSQSKAGTRVNMKYNEQSKLFACYASGQKEILIYRKVVSSEPSSTYDIIFNVNGGVFAEGEGKTITKNVGETETITFPTIEMTPFKYSVLTCWSDGTNIYRASDTPEVSGKTTFKAIYSSPSRDLTFAQVLEVAELTGTKTTNIKFSATGKVATKSSKYNYTFKSLDSEDDTEVILYFSGAGNDTLSVGDEIHVVGGIATYNGSPEFVVDSYTITKPAYATSFAAEQTKASLKIDDTVSIRFGNIISAASFNENATYGVVVTKDAAGLTGLTKDGLEELAALGQAVECHPVRVNAQGEEDANGEYYQFALVLTEVPAHEYTATLYAAMYVIVKDNVYLAQVKEASVKSVAAAYLEGDVSNFSATTIEILNVLANA